MSQFKTIEQERASAAWQKVEGLGSVSDEYLSLVRSFSAMVLMNGLGQTIAFFLAKGKSHHLQLSAHLAEWLLREEKAIQPKTPQALMKYIIDAESNRSYRYLRNESLAFGAWLKRFAEAKSKMAEADKVNASGQSTEVPA